MFFRWPFSVTECNIAILELIPVVVACFIWGGSWARYKIQFEIDNMAVVYALNSGLPRDPALAFLVRELNLLAVIHSFRYRAVHVPGRFNQAADALSRFDFDRFKRLCPDSDSDPTQVSEDFISHLFSN